MFTFKNYFLLCVLYTLELREVMEVEYYLLFHSGKGRGGFLAFKIFTISPLNHLRRVKHQTFHDSFDALLMKTACSISAIIFPLMSPYFKYDCSTIKHFGVASYYVSFTGSAVNKLSDYLCYILFLYRLN